MGKNKNELYNELLRQVEGLIDIEIGNYAYDNDLELFYEVLPDCLNIYVDEIGSEYKNVWDRHQIGHYHDNDLLYLILYFEKEKQRMLNYINEYIKE